jgi:hypothetical protein
MTEEWLMASRFNYEDSRDLWQEPELQPESIKTR